ncbi:hypothetical protein GTY57_26485 [Streptomyces sp. SID5475]|nr:hypothetical protein [Streptomyces sp. SID5475]
MSSEQRPSTGASSPDAPRPARLSAAAALCAAEGVVLAGFGAYLLLMGLLGDPSSPQQAEMRRPAGAADRATRTEPGAARGGHSSTRSLSRSCARVRASSRETCICEMPTSCAI